MTSILVYFETLSIVWELEFPTKAAIVMLLWPKRISESIPFNSKDLSVSVPSAPEPVRVRVGDGLDRRPRPGARLRHGALAAARPAAPGEL